jgi:hypothetical protein
VQISHLGATFAEEFFRGRNIKPHSPEHRAAKQTATTVMMELIVNVYKMFPPPGKPSIPKPYCDDDGVHRQGAPTAQQSLVLLPNQRLDPDP